MEGLTAGEEGEGEEKGGEEGEVTEMVKVESSLNFFELKLFREEPPLVSVNLQIYICNKDDRVWKKPR